MTTESTVDTNADLAAAPPEHVIAVADGLATRYRVQALSVPRSGLALLAMQDAVFGEPFHLGEVPLATAAVTVIDDAGREHTGGAALLSDRDDLVTAAAVCDAVLRAKLAGWEAVADLCAAGAERRAQREAARAQARENTRVDFAELGQDDDTENA